MAWHGIQVVVQGVAACVILVYTAHRMKHVWLMCDECDGVGGECTAEWSSRYQCYQQGAKQRGRGDGDERQRWWVKTRESESQEGEAE